MITEPLTLSGNAATVRAADGIELAGDIVLSASEQANIQPPNGGGTLTISGNISGLISGQRELRFRGYGGGSEIIVLEGNNTFDADTRLTDNVIVRSASANSIPDASLLRLNGTSTFDLNGTNETLGAIGGSATATLIIGNSTLTAGFGNQSLNYAGAITGSGTLVKTGSGVQTLSGVSTFSGDVQINDGRLQVDGTLPAAIDINTGATIGGTGTVGTVAANSGSTVAPGNSPGILNTGNFDLQAGSTLEIELGGLGANPGTDYDQVDVTGSVSLAGTLDLRAYSNYAAGQTFTIINNDGSDPVTGTFAGLSNGATYQIGGSLLTIDYFGGDGNDVTLTADATDVFVVTNTNNSGAGSLRQAILDANSSGGLDAIAFNIAGAGPHTIQPTSALPSIAGQVSIDGFTEPDTFITATPVVVINGALAGNVDGLTLDVGSDGSVINGLVINGFTQDGIQILNSDNHVITANYIGTDVTGTAEVENIGSGIDIHGGDNISIGGSIAQDGNVISGNRDHGVHIKGGSQFVTLQANRIGTDVTGTQDLGNRFNGVQIEGDSNPVDASKNNFIGVAGGIPNVIAGNGDTGGSASNGAGIAIVGTNSSGNTIQNNYIGVASDGVTALRNTDHGIQILAGNNGNQIGGTAAGSGNIVIGPTNQRGIRVLSDSNTIQGNLVGVGLGGNTAIGSGIGLEVTGSNNLIGGYTAAARNIISANTSVNLSIAGAGNTVVGNYIGTNAAGNASLGSNGTGIEINSATGAIIGGDDAADGMVDGVINARNIIAGNNDAILIQNHPSTATIRGNWIGLAADGTTVIGNSGDGIEIRAESQVIGGTTAGSANTIVGNQVGINAQVWGGHTVFGNFIGTDETQTVVRRKRSRYRFQQPVLHDWRCQRW